MKLRDSLTELRSKDASALVSRLAELEAEVLKLRFDYAFRKLKQTHRVRDVRKEIARIHTILREQVVAQQEQSTTA